MVAATLWPLLGVAVLVHVPLEATSDSERRSSEVAFEEDATRSSSTHGNLALHMRKAARSLRGLRSRRSSHQRFATSFRSAEAQDMLQAPTEATIAAGTPVSNSVLAPQAALYVPKIGLANITEPTALPPPPPPLDPWKDMQPVDTAVGHYLISGFLVQPTASPPPTQMSLDLAFGCPVLLTWPTEVTVQAPDECVSVNNGNWTSGQSNDLLIYWDKECFGETRRQLAMTSAGIEDELNAHPVVTYRVPNGDLFGTSQESQGWNNLIVLRDCGGAMIYTIEEKLFKQEGEANEDLCEKYKSCDGVIYLQYFIKDKSGNVVAQTPYINLFQESFEIVDPFGVNIAKVSRNGWDPPFASTDCSTSAPRVWNIKYAGSAPGMWRIATNQWPIAEMMTMLARRDMNRKPDGSVEWGACEVVRSTGLVFLFLGIVCCFVCTPFIIFLICSGPCHQALYDVEQSFFPKRMGKPAKYGN